MISSYMYTYIYIYSYTHINTSKYIHIYYIAAASAFNCYLLLLLLSSSSSSSLFSLVLVPLSSIIIIWVAVHTRSAGARYKDAMAKAPALPNGAFLTDALQCQPLGSNMTSSPPWWFWRQKNPEGKLCQQSHMHPLHVVSWMHWMHWIQRWFSITFFLRSLDHFRFSCDEVHRYSWLLVGIRERFPGGCTKGWNAVSIGEVATFHAVWFSGHLWTKDLQSAGTNGANTSAGVGARTSNTGTGGFKCRLHAQSVKIPFSSGVSWDPCDTIFWKIRIDGKFGNFRNSKSSGDETPRQKPKAPGESAKQQSGVWMSQPQTVRDGI